MFNIIFDYFFILKHYTSYKMHYTTYFGSYDKIHNFTTRMVNSYYNAWPPIYNPDEIHDKFMKLCREYGRESLWFVTIDSLGYLVGFCTLGRLENTHIELYNLFLDKEYKNSGFDKKLFLSASIWIKKQKKRMFWYVKNEDEQALSFYKLMKGKEIDLFPKDGFITMVYS